MKLGRSISLALAVLVLLRADAGAQYAAPAADQREGSLSVSFQNYYNRVNGSTVYNAQGGGVRLRRFYSRLGLLSAQFEPLVSNGKVLFGDNYLSLTGVPWKGRHWDLYGGEFRAETSLVENPFQNYQLPQLGLRGGRVIARTEKWTASTFAGQQTLAQGSRVSFRRAIPQTVFGATLAGQIGEKLQLGFRVLQMKVSTAEEERTASLLPVGRRVISSTTATTQTSVKLNKRVRVYGEASVNRSKMAVESTLKPSRVSWVAGQAYEGNSLKLRGNYLFQGIGYLPAAGYYLGDRRGPSFDGSYHIGPIGFSGNWLQSSNNVEGDLNAAQFFSRQGGGNFYGQLPWGFSVSGSASQISLRSSHPADGNAYHRQRQYLSSIGRPVYRHNLRFSWLRTEQRMFGISQQISSLELEDSFNWRSITASGAVRLQSIAGSETRDSYFTRASLLWGRGKLNIYANWEQGRDLANESLFSTSINSTSVVGLTWAAPSGMAIRLEGFRIQNSSYLNPQNLFLLNTRGIVPDAALSRNNDWNVFLRVSREMGWGSHMTDGGPNGFAAQAPLIGSISGYVKLRTLAGELPAANVWIAADNGVKVRTDAGGFFAITEIFQGRHSLKLDEDRLPADFSPNAPSELLIDVKADQTSRAELSVVPLVYFEGVVKDQDGSPVPEGIVLALHNGTMQTTTDEKGRFGFYGLAEGEYQVEMISTMLPDETPFSYPEIARVSLRHAVQVPAVQVKIFVQRQGPKPLKEVNLVAAKTAIPVPSPGRAKPAPNAKGAPKSGRPGVRGRTAQGSGKVIAPNQAPNQVPNQTPNQAPPRASAPAPRGGRKVLGSTAAATRRTGPASVSTKAAQSQSERMGSNFPAVSRSDSRAAAVAPELSAAAGNRRLLVQSVN